MLYSQLASVQQAGTAPVAAPPPAQTNALPLSTAAVAIGFSTALPPQPSSLAVSPAAIARGEASSRDFAVPFALAVTTLTTIVLYTR